MFVINGDEISECPQLGASVYCQKCKEWHEVEHSSILAFCKCSGTLYLVGLRGKMVSPIFHTEEPIDEA